MYDAARIVHSFDPLVYTHIGTYSPEVARRVGHGVTRELTMFDGGDVLDGEPPLALHWQLEQRACQLVSLTLLKIEGVPNLATLFTPSACAVLGATLNALWLEECTGLGELPPTVGLLTALKTLKAPDSAISGACLATHPQIQMLFLPV